MASHGGTPAAPNPDLTRRQRRTITVGVMLVMFLAALDGTVVSTAMPTVIADLGGFAIYSWVFSIYMLAATVSGPVWGRLSDLYGRKRFFLGGIGLFLVGSMLAGQSTTMTMLIATRALQGLGAGAIMPLSITIIGDIYSLEERARMQGLFSGVWGVASILGPLLGGLLTDAASWRWVFYVNVPFGIAAALVVFFTMQDPAMPRRRVKIDYLGALALTGSVTLLLLGLLQGGRLGWLDPNVYWMLGVSLGLLVFFVFWERRVDEPIFPLSLFKNKMFTAAAASGLFVGMAMFGTISFLPLFAQGVTGVSATQAGMTLTPFMLAWVVSSAIGGRLLLRIGYRSTVMIGMGFMVLGFLMFSTFGPDSARAYVLAGVGVAGAGIGLVIVSLLLAVQNSVSKAQLGTATSASIFARQIGGTVGVAILGTVMTVGMQTAVEQVATDNLTAEQVEQLTYLAQHPDAVVAGEPGQFYDAVLFLIRDALAFALHNVFLVGLGFVLIALLTAFLIPRGRAQEHVYTGD